MTLFMRILFYSLIGIAGGILSWPINELIIFFQPNFPSLLIFSICSGVAIGLLMGGCFGMGEGIITISREKIFSGMLWGLLTGAIGGVIGFVAGQAILLFLGTLVFNSNIQFKTIAFPLSKALGWAIFGICIGISEGIRSKSLLKIRNGIFGGFLGGMLGGLAFEYLRILLSVHFISRLAGLILLGLLIGLFYGFIETRLAKASLQLLSGGLKGREYPLTQHFTTIGASPLTVVNLPGYQNIEDVHTEIAKEKDGFYLTQQAEKKQTYVNDEQVEKKKLENGDVIRIGNAQFQFKQKK